MAGEGKKIKIKNAKCKIAESLRDDVFNKQNHLINLVDTQTTLGETQG